MKKFTKLIIFLNFKKVKYFSLKTRKYGTISSKRDEKMQKTIELNQDNRIKQLRQKEHLTLKELSQKVEVPYNTLSQYENGKRKTIPSKTFNKLKSIFNVNDSFLQGYGYEKEYLDKMLFDAYSNNYGCTYINADFYGNFNNGNNLNYDITIYSRNVIDCYYYLTNQKDCVTPIGLLGLSWIFKTDAVKNLLITKDHFSENEIKDILIRVIFNINNYLSTIADGEMHEEELPF